MKIRMRKLNEGADPTLGGVSYNVQGNPMYTYTIMALNHDLEQQPNKPSNDRYIYPGCTVKGVSANNKDISYTGQLYRIVKDEKGEIQYLYIRDIKTNRFVTILADSNLELITHKKEIHTKTPEFSMAPSHNIKI